MYVSQAAFNTLDSNQGNLRAYIKIKQLAVCVAPSPDLTDDCAYLDEALCSFVGVSPGDRIDVEPIKVLIKDFISDMSIKVWPVGSCVPKVGNSQLASLAYRVCQAFHRTLVHNNQTLFVRCHNADWKVVVCDVRGLAANLIPWGYMGPDVTVYFREIQVAAKTEQETCADSRVTAKVEQAASLAQRIEKLEAEVCSLRSILDSFQLQIPPTNQQQAKVAEPLANPISSKQTFCVQTAKRAPHMKPIVTSTTFYENLVDAKTAFDVLVKRRNLERMKSDDDNAFNLLSSNIQMLEIAADFDQVFDDYAMLGTKQPEPV